MKSKFICHRFWALREAGDRRIVAIVDTVEPLPWGKGHARAKQLARDACGWSRMPTGATLAGVDDDVAVDLMKIKAVKTINGSNVENQF